MKKIYLLLLISSYLQICQSQIVNIPDNNFKNTLLNHNPVIDTNSDGEIQMSEAQATTVIFAAQDNISSMEGLQFFTNLEELECFTNSLTNLDLTQNVNLKYVYCQNNNIASIDISNCPALEVFEIDNNLLTEIDVSQNLSLRFLDVENNLLTTLHLNLNNALEGFECNSNDLTSLYIKNGSSIPTHEMRFNDNPNLQYICADSNEISQIQTMATSYGYNDVIINSDCSLNISDVSFLPETSIYPNPAFQKLNIHTNDEVRHVSIIDINGRIIKEFTFDTPSPNTQIDIEELISGIYLLNIQSFQGNLIKKIIKK